MSRIEDYVAYVLESPETAARLYQRISEAIASLETLPERCRVIGQHPAYPRGIRRLLIDNYSILYYIDDDAVIVVRVQYGASDLSMYLRNE